MEQKIGKRIQEQRKKKGYTQEQLAEILDISPNHLSALERGVYGVKLEKLIQIINALGCTADDLLQDVIHSGRQYQASLLSQQLSTLSPEEQRRIMDVVATMIRSAKEK
ncbi:MAG: helix-turn-helix transcriptional regulator [Ruminococcaceae bacterium]|nr:helix-turn-helix transcriptional regulator [Oscillospiraceae bacterium]